ncbi:FMRFamide-related neuropeptides-like [Littorina saxatilis]|uniref:FMRFamide-related neuropeptides-like n=1 Tax=Littorina saxatilis TaxID=31220 RepID=UPI0038B58228
MALLSAEGAHLRKRRDVSEESSDLARTKRDVVLDGGFLRFGKSSDVATDVAADKRGSGSDVIPSDREYLRFGRGSTKFNKRYLRFGRSGPEGYLRFGKRSTKESS